MTETTSTIDVERAAVGIGGRDLAKSRTVIETTTGTVRGGENAMATVTAVKESAMGAVTAVIGMEI